MNPHDSDRDDSDSDGDDIRSTEHDDEPLRHDHHEHDVETVHIAVVTVSTSRTIEEDAAGDAIAAVVEDAGHSVVVRELIDDDYDDLQATLNRLIDRDDVDLLVTSGGTGVTPDDVTVEAVHDMVDKALPGFGELFRRISYDEIGTRVVGTRTTAGVADGTPVFCLPGSESAGRLGTEEIIVPEAPHLVGLAARD